MTERHCVHCKCDESILNVADPECSQNHWGPHELSEVVARVDAPTQTKTATRIKAPAVAGLLSVSVGTVYRYAKAGHIPARKVLRNWIFIREQIEAWLSDGGDTSA